MKNLLSKLCAKTNSKWILGCSSVAFTMQSFGFNQSSLTNTGATGAESMWGTSGKAMTWLNYAMYASIVVAIAALAFLLFANGNETIMKSGLRTLVVATILAVATSSPSWLSFNIF